jgi:hypothetical protein
VVVSAAEVAARELFGAVVDWEEVGEGATDCE